MKRSVKLLGGLLAIQVVWGAFVAGLKAGFFANTFPLMGGRLIPATLLEQQPMLRNFVENPATVQWLHRVLGTLLVICAIVVFGRLSLARVDKKSLKLSLGFLLVVVIQYLLGVLTLIHAVPVPLGVTHQATAMILFGVWVTWLHHIRELSRN